MKNVKKLGQQRRKIGTTKTKKPQSLPFKLLNKQGNKTTRLLSVATDKVTVDGKNRWYDYRFNEFVFVTYIVVEAEGYGVNDKFAFQWINGDGSTLTRTVTFKDKKAYVWIRDVVKLVRFQPPSKWFASPKINNVRIAGIPKSEIGSFLTIVDDLEALKKRALEVCDKAIENAQQKNSEIAALENNIAAKAKEIEVLEESRSNAVRENSDIKLQIDGLLAEKARLDQSVKSESDRLSKIEEEVSIRTSERKRLAEDISEKSTELKSLQDNINIFPIEIIGFADQSAKNISLYWKLIAAPILMILIMFGLLVFSAADLTTVVNANERVDIWSIFLTRLPYVAIATIIVTASYKICRVFISEMIKINQQRLGLTKISIIAKDIASSSERGLDLSEEERFQLRSQLKMELLRDHMKAYLTKDFKLALPQNIMKVLQRGREDISEAISDMEDRVESEVEETLEGQP